MLTPVRRRLPPRVAFLLHFAFRLGIALSVVLVALAAGAYGYHRTERLSWIDSTLNAAMILTGMGPVNPMQTTAGKIFATCYALFSGVFFLTMVALLFAPLLHRFLHRFHLDLYDNDDAAPRKDNGGQS